MYGREEKCIQDVWRGNLREGDKLEDPGEGRMILKWIFNNRDEGHGLN